MNKINNKTRRQVKICIPVSDLSISMTKSSALTIAAPFAAVGAWTVLAGKPAPFLSSERRSTISIWLNSQLTQTIADYDLRNKDQCWWLLIIHFTRLRSVDVTWVDAGMTRPIYAHQNLFLMRTNNPNTRGIFLVQSLLFPRYDPWCPCQIFWKLGRHEFNSEKFEFSISPYQIAFSTLSSIVHSDPRRKAKKEKSKPHKYYFGGKKSELAIVTSPMHVQKILAKKRHFHDIVFADRTDDMYIIQLKSFMHRESCHLNWRVNRPTSSYHNYCHIGIPLFIYNTSSKYCNKERSD